MLATHVGGLMLPLAARPDAVPAWYAWAQLIEAGIWISVGLGVALWALRRGGQAPFQPSQRVVCIAIVALISFGVSDIVESRSGAWWRPWWLLVWKATCVVVLAWLAWAFRSRGSSRS